jgi:hypothetical protein
MHSSQSGETGRVFGNFNDEADSCEEYKEVEVEWSVNEEYCRDLERAKLCVSEEFDIDINS